MATRVMMYRAVKLLAVVACFGCSQATFVSPHGMLEVVAVNPQPQLSQRSASEVPSKMSTPLRRQAVDGNGEEVHNSTIASAEEIFNEVALKSSDGDFLGYSVAARGNILGLGWGGRGLVSSDADRKGWFYTVEDGMQGVSSTQWDPMLTATSEEFACFAHESFVQCLAHNENRTSTQLAATDHWAPAPDLFSVYPDVCTWPTRNCFGIAMALWARSIAVSGRGRGGAHFVTVYDLQYDSGTLAWDCLSGCNSSNSNPNITVADIQGSDETFGSALAMEEDVIVVGAPGARGGEGEVFVYVAQDSERREWALSQRIAVNGTRQFGKAVALGAGMLVVGAPGGSDAMPGVHVFRLTRQRQVNALDASAARTGRAVQATRMCQVVDDNVAHQSRLGWSVDMQAYPGGAFLAVGAPGTAGVDTCSNQVFREQKQCSSRVFMMAADTAKGECEARDYVIQGQDEGYGSAVGMTLGVVFVGAPDYLKRNWDNSLTSGLVYIYTYCQPGEYSVPEYRNGGLERDCVACGAGTWSDGGHATVCAACVPFHSTVIGQCGYECVPNYFGTDCLPCSLSELADPGQLPANASWVDGRAECAWECDAGFYSPDGARCEACTERAEDSNGEWVRGTCGWVCRAGFFDSADTSTPDCVPCSALRLRDGVSAPANAYWVDGWPNCTFVPRVGYRCNGTECSPCPGIPAQANWSAWAPRETERCAFECLPGYFGHPHYHGVCATCSELQTRVKPAADRPPLPARAAWQDGLECTADSWACVGGAVRSPWSDPMGGGYCCPANISHAVASPGTAPCEVECEEGFWWSMPEAACLACPAKPRHSHWVEGNCTFGPDLGYFCDGATCQSCELHVQRPEHAEWVLQDPNAAACPYQCSQGFFGHPFSQFWGECLVCSAYMARLPAAADKPKNSQWNDDVTVCNEGSWVCDAGFREGFGDDYCCPQTIPNSHPAPEVAPCGVTCDAGHWWDAGAAGCRECGAKPERSAWNETGTCSWACVPGYFPWQGACLLCSEYRAARGSSLPGNAVWDDGSGLCGDTDWVCLTGFEKSLVAQPAGCCPLSMGQGGVRGDEPAKCNFECVTGWKWEPVVKDCVRCAGWNPVVVPPAHTHWNDSLCAFQCDHGYKAEPPAPASPDRCVDCPTQAAEAGWWLPEDAQWLRGPQPQCSNATWECKDGFVQHGDEPRCCNTVFTYVPQGVDEIVAEGRGGWVEGECKWECADGFHPQQPKREWYGLGRDCLACDQYLAKLGVNCTTCQGKTIRPDAEQCWAAATAHYQLSLIRSRDFTAKVQADFVLATAASLEQAVPYLDLDWQAVKVVSYSERSARRAEGSGAAVLKGEIVRRAGTVLEVVVAVERLDPAKIDDVQTALVATPKQVQQNMFGMGHQFIISEEVTVELGPSEDAWECDEGFVRNDYTGQCCESEYFSPPTYPERGTERTLEIDPARYRWSNDGCVWTCREGFRGTHCHTCAEYNELLQRFKPPNSVWEPDSADCSSWRCVEGFVKSSTGFSCVSLAQLYSVCTANHRCFDCLKQEDCVWCGSMPNGRCNGDDDDEDDDCGAGSCLPGVSSTETNEGWMYLGDGNLSSVATCEGEYCSSECEHKKCSDCVQDRACGWCISSERCMMGDQVRPQREVCRAGWLFAHSQQCGTDQGLWLIGLIVACVAMLVVGLCCCFCIVKVRMRIQQQEHQVLQAQQNQADVRRITSRFLATFPTFKYNGNRPARNSSSSGTASSRGTSTNNNTTTNIDDEEEPACSICLGEFAEGEECRMLPCLHVFHRPCIDQWLGVSHECPLCKQSVINQGNAHLVQDSSFAQEQGQMFGGQIPAGAGFVRPVAPPPGAAPSAPAITEPRASPGEVEMVSAITLSPSPLRGNNAPPLALSVLNGRSNSTRSSASARNSAARNSNRAPGSSRALAPRATPAPPPPPPPATHPPLSPPPPAVEQSASPSPPGMEHSAALSSPAPLRSNGPDAAPLSPAPIESEASMSPRTSLSPAGAPAEIEMRPLALSGSAVSLRVERAESPRADAMPSPPPAEAAGTGTTGEVGGGKKEGSPQSGGPMGLQDDGVGEGEDGVECPVPGLEDGEGAAESERDGGEAPARADAGREVAC